jgi:RNA polymerase sigma-70 factor (ECF subfamily)
MPSQASWSDDQGLFRLARGGEPKATRVLVESLSPRAHALAWRMLGDAAEAEDVLQEAFIRLFNGAEFQGQSRLGTFFHTLVARLCLDRIRQRKPELLLETQDFETLSEAEQSSFVDPEDQLSDQQQADHMQAAIARLSPRQRMAISLWAYHDFEAIDIARALDCDLNAAHQCLHRAKISLRKLLQGNIGHE